MAEQIKNLALRAWFPKAADHGRLHESWTEIKKGSEQHRSWLAYFGPNVPYTLRHIEMNKNKSWTAPCEWPYDMPFQCEAP